MVTGLLHLALRHRSYAVLATVALALLGVWAAVRLPIDAVPDITNVQVQINTAVPALAPEEIEKLVTFPIESELAGLPAMLELRSLSKFGLSQVTMTFEDGTDIYRTRQLVTERLQGVLDDLPKGVEPRLAPISTGLGEIYYYTLRYKKDAPNAPATSFERLLNLKLVQEYTVKPLLRGTRGLAEVNTSGGYEKQIVVMPDARRLTGLGMTFEELGGKLAENVENAGGGLVDIGSEQIVVRGATRVQTLDEIANLPLKFAAGVTPVLVKDVAEVGVGSSIRTGASTEDGEEALVGGAIMLMGENSRLVARAVREKLADIQGKLPEGVEIVTGYDRSDLVSATIRTVQKNLFEGAVLVVVILFAMLGNWRAAVIVALTIPLSMLFAITGMVEARISGNLMSLGAIDFGMIIDGSVVMVENILRHLAEKQHALGRRLTAEERLREVLASGREVANPMFFGVLIITIVYVPILALTGIEGKMFRPMAATVIFALVGALLVALTVMPVLCALLLGGDIRETDNAVVVWFKRAYQPILMFALRRRLIIVGTAVVVFASSLVAFSRLGAEFMPQLDEGSLLVQMIRSTSISLDASLGLQMRSEKVLLEHFPEVVHTFSKLGTAEIATDPMGPNVSDTFVLCRPEAEWRREGGRPISKEELIERMRRELTKHVPGQTYLFTQPIQMRFNEIMAGARADIAVKIYGDEFEELERLAGEVRDALRTVPGGGDVEFEAIGRTPMLEIVPDREAMRRLNVHAEDLNATIRGALGGLDVGTLVEGNRRYPVLVRLAEDRRRDLEAIKRLPVRSDEGGIVPLGVVATLQVNERVGSIAREANQRRVAILINLRGRDVEGFVTDAVAKIKEKVKFPEGYYFEFGGQFENLQEARRRLSIVVPLTLLLIFGLIFLAFDSVRQALLIFLCVPLAMTGGVLALVVRGMPFSISAAVGFIALSGIAVLNGLMLISFINQLREQGRELRQAVVEGALTRLRPKLMTAFVASLGFVPMAIATGSGAEVQRPLATVVIGGVLSSTFLTLVLLPTLYEWIERRALERQPATDCSQE